jgi:hypothetical protein
MKLEPVGVQDAVDLWAGLGDTIENPADTTEGRSEYTGSGPPPGFWSETYQWLPSNLAFQEDGTVLFTSYINNLHPKKYPDIYRALEKLIDVSIPAWDHCLLAEGRESERAARIHLPTKSYYDDNDEDCWETMVETFARCGQNLENLGLRDLEKFCDSELSPEDPLFIPMRNKIGDRPDLQQMMQAFKDKYHESIEDWLWRRHRSPIIPEPDEYSGDEEDFNESENLKQRFRESGLQVIVKMATIELTPDKPEFPVGSWHVR